MPRDPTGNHVQQARGRHADAAPPRHPDRRVSDAAGPRRRPRGPAGRLTRASVPGPVPDHGRQREVQAGVSRLLAGRGQVRGRGVHRARHDLRRAAQGQAPPRRLRGGRGAEAAQERHREGGLSRRAADHDPARHVRHQRRGAGGGEPAPPVAGRGVRGGHPPERATAVLGADHPLPGLVGRVHDRHPRRDLRPHRQEEEVPGHRPAPGVRAREQRGHSQALLRDEGPEHHREAGGPAGEARGHRLAPGPGRAEPRGCPRGSRWARWATS